MKMKKKKKVKTPSAPSHPSRIKDITKDERKMCLFLENEYQRE
jgi:hypothetical protein